LPVGAAIANQIQKALFDRALAFVNAHIHAEEF